MPRDPSSFKPLAFGNETGIDRRRKKPIRSHTERRVGLAQLRRRPAAQLPGQADPDFAGSFGFNIAFAGNFELNTLFEYKFGHQVQDLSGMFRRANGFIGRNTPRSAELYSTMVNPASSAEQRLDRRSRGPRRSRDSRR